MTVPPVAGADGHPGSHIHHTASFPAKTARLAKRRLRVNGDVEEASGAAPPVGDDTVQQKMQGQAAPDSFPQDSGASRPCWRPGRAGESRDAFGARSL